MKEGPPRRAFFLSSSASVLRQQTVLVSPGEPTGNAHLTAPHADGLKLGELSLPLGTARASVAAGHLALGNCHVHRSSLLMAASCGTWSVASGRCAQHARMDMLLHEAQPTPSVQRLLQPPRGGFAHIRALQRRNAARASLYGQTPRCERKTGAVAGRCGRQRPQRLQG